MRGTKKYFTLISKISPSFCFEKNIQHHNLEKGAILVHFLPFRLVDRFLIA